MKNKNANNTLKNIHHHQKFHRYSTLRINWIEYIASTHRFKKGRTLKKGWSFFP